MEGLRRQQRNLRDKESQAFLHGILGLGGMGLGMHFDRKSRKRDELERLARQEELNIRRREINPLRYQIGTPGYDI
jgi:hypothetical protein